MAGPTETPTAGPTAAFMRYPSLLNEKQGKSYSDARWIVTEKLHGCNFQFRVDADGIRVFRRNGELKPGEKFHDWETMRERLRDALMRLRLELGARVIHVFGELVGGTYPGIPSSCKPIQTQIYYSPTYEFFVFDIIDEGETELDLFSHAGKVPVDYATMISACETSGLRVVTPWYTHVTFDDIKTFDFEEENSRIPIELGLPDPPGRNIIEGWVLRSGSLRVKWRTKRFRNRREEPTPSRSNSVDQGVVDYVKSLITKERLESVKSKELDLPLRGYATLMRADILEELDNQPNRATSKAITKAIFAFVEDATASTFGDVGSVGDD
jgi:hypothetical protein